MELLTPIWKFLTDQGNSAAIGTILAVVTALAGLAWFIYTRITAPKLPINEGEVRLPLSEYDAKTKKIAELEDQLANRQKAIEAEAIDNPESRALLELEMAEVNRRRANLEETLQAREETIESLKAQLGNAETETEQAALAALEDGDLDQARELFEQVQAETSMAVQKSAKAAFALGQIAEEQIRWHDAAGHYADAAKLHETLNHLAKAREYAWRSGDYQTALHLGPKMIQAAIEEHGERSREHSAALNDHAIALKDTGRYDEAEPLYRQDIEITGKTLGKEHPDYAISLNNLAGLLEKTGRHDEAEPFYRQAIEIGEKTLGKEHPNYAIRLNNLAELLRETGRFAEAEPLHKQAMEITEKTLGKEHPEYATRLNNLAGLLKETGRYAEAEPLYRQAMEITEKTLGKEHPDYAISLNNLAGLLRQTGRRAEAEPLYRQALEIFTASYGDEHPHTKIVAQHLENLLNSK